MNSRNGSQPNCFSLLRRAQDGLRVVALAAAIFMAMAGSVAAQGTLAQWRKLAPPMKRWTALHPFAARKAQPVAVMVIAITDSVRMTGTLGGALEGGKLDGFRHMLWMALLVRRMSPGKAQRLGRAYERGNHWQFRQGQLENGSLQDSSASVMDLGNNGLGCSLGREMRDWPLQRVVDRLVALAAAGGCYRITAPMPQAEPRRWNNHREVLPPSVAD